MTALASTTQTLSSSYKYDPWGGNLTSSGSSANPLRCIGGYPINYSDPSGLDANIGAACVAGALSALVTVGIVALAIAGCVGGITYEVIYDLLT